MPVWQGLDVIPATIQIHLCSNWALMAWHTTPWAMQAPVPPAVPHLRQQRPQRRHIWPVTRQWLRPLVSGCWIKLLRRAGQPLCWQGDWLW